ncbi:unnamed protein product [Amoebophrya sp. A25]|nr:unnamed protein product [Amoebophrya sp. A25]|eukprot:GSA25T00019202001.1
MKEQDKNGMLLVRTGQEELQLDQHEDNEEKILVDASSAQARDQQQQQQSAGGFRGGTDVGAGINSAALNADPRVATGVRRNQRISLGVTFDSKRKLKNSSLSFQIQPGNDHDQRTSSPSTTRKVAFSVATQPRQEDENGHQAPGTLALAEREQEKETADIDTTEEDHQAEVGVLEVDEQDLQEENASDEELAEAAANAEEHEEVAQEEDEQVGASAIHLEGEYDATRHSHHGKSLVGKNKRGKKGKHHHKKKHGKRVEVGGNKVGAGTKSTTKNTQEGNSAASKAAVTKQKTGASLKGADKDKQHTGAEKENHVKKHEIISSVDLNANTKKSDATVDTSSLAAQVLSHVSTQSQRAQEKLDRQHAAAEAELQKKFEAEKAKLDKEFEQESTKYRADQKEEQEKALANLGKRIISMSGQHPPQGQDVKQWLNNFSLINTAQRHRGDNLDSLAQDSKALDETATNLVNSETLAQDAAALQAAQDSSSSSSVIDEAKDAAATATGTGRNNTGSTQQTPNPTEPMKKLMNEGKNIMISGRIDIQVADMSALGANRSAELSVARVFQTLFQSPLYDLRLRILSAADAARDPTMMDDPGAAATLPTEKALSMVSSLLQTGSGPSHGLHFSVFNSPLVKLRKKDDPTQMSKVRQHMEDETAGSAGGLLASTSNTIASRLQSLVSIATTTKASSAKERPTFDDKMHQEEKSVQSIQKIIDHATGQEKKMPDPQLLSLGASAAARGVDKTTTAPGETATGDAAVIALQFRIGQLPSEIQALLQSGDVSDAWEALIGVGGITSVTSVSMKVHENYQETSSESLFWPPGPAAFADYQAQGGLSWRPEYCSSPFVTKEVYGKQSCADCIVQFFSSAYYCNIQQNCFSLYQECQRDCSANEACLGFQYNGRVCRHVIFPPSVAATSTFANGILRCGTEEFPTPNAGCLNWCEKDTTVVSAAAASKPSDGTALLQTYVRSAIGKTWGSLR